MEPQKPSTKPITSKILKFLPKATSSVSFQNPPVYSPAKDKKTSDKTHKSNLGIGFSGPMASIVPSDNRRNLNTDGSTFTLIYEPTSPRVSCMGTVKCKHYRKLAAAAAAANAAGKHKHTTNKFISQTTSSFTPPVKTIKNEENIIIQEKVIITKKKASIRSLFRGGSRRKTDEKSTEKSTTGFTIPTTTTLPRAPSLGKMKRFSSGRDAFTNFDWTTQVIPLDSADHKKYFTDDDDDERDGGGEEEIMKIPSSAPVMERNKGFCENFVRVGGVNNLEPRKEINLWKRRTMAQPMPLQLHAADN